MNRRFGFFGLVSRTVPVAVNRLPAFLIASTLTAIFLVAAVAQTASFQPLGQMPGVDPGAGTFASAISGNGSTITGWAWVCPNGQPTCSSTGKTEAYLWTEAAHFQLLGDLGSQSTGSMPFAISSNGSVIVGEAPVGTNSFGAFRWTAAGGMVALPLPMIFANAVTEDGLMVAGGDYWWKTSGQMGKFGPFPGNADQTNAFGLSASSKAPVAVGDALNGSGPGGSTDNAFRWTPAGGLQDIGIPGVTSDAFAVSADGTVVVGEVQVANETFEAFRWTAATGMQLLGTLGGPESSALAVNKDGSVIVGTSLGGGSSGSSEAFRWTAQTGMQSLLQLLQAAGVTNANNWLQLTTAVGVSADGTTIAGYGISPKTMAHPFGLFTPFRVVLPVP